MKAIPGSLHLVIYVWIEIRVIVVRKRLLMQLVLHAFVVLPGLELLHVIMIIRPSLMLTLVKHLIRCRTLSLSVHLIHHVVHVNLSFHKVGRRLRHVLHPFLVLLAQVILLNSHACIVQCKRIIVITIDILQLSLTLFIFLLRFSTAIPLLFVLICVVRLALILIVLWLLEFFVVRPIFVC